MIEDWGEIFMKAVLAMLLILMMSMACSPLNKKFGLDDDNSFEEFVEREIAHQTGLDVDLSPDTPED